ncbi:hypothetical protein RND81_03G140900 [Saponaria officinalis]|uniref:Uncharacterized protein n=1 Tax=Saponaria officinalis TaxID=3572 RepID=A0AAW1M0D8_SAPOF
MGRPPCCDKANVKRGLWTAEEDAKILAYVSTHGTGNWTQVPKKAGLNRCGKSCRLRWTNYLRPDLKHEEFTEHEEQLIIQYHAAIGSRWSLIAKQLPGRTDNDVKNYWNTKLKKKLSKLGIDPVTHKPYTKIYSDFQSISCLTTIQQPTFVDQNPVSSLSSIQSGMSRLHLTDHFQDVYSYSNNCLLQQESFNHYMEELSPTSSSSSSSSSSSISNSQSSSCLLSFTQPPLLTTDDVKEEEHNTTNSFLATNLPTQNQENNGQFAPVVSNLDTTTQGKNTTEANNHYDPSSVSSFVKTLLDRDSEMQLSFPVFEDILDY